jgi:hypothetical protein
MPESEEAQALPRGLCCHAGCLLDAALADFGQPIATGRCRTPANHSLKSVILCVPGPNGAPSSSSPEKST